MKRMTHGALQGRGGANRLVQWHHGRPRRSERGGGYGARLLMWNGPTGAVQDGKLTYEGLGRRW
jgi:hypothetical protein